jgi:hypothetical protein
MERNTIVHFRKSFFKITFIQKFFLRQLLTLEFFIKSQILTDSYFLGDITKTLTPSARKMFTPIFYDCIRLRMKSYDA